MNPPGRVTGAGTWRSSAHTACLAPTPEEGSVVTTPRAARRSVASAMGPRPGSTDPIRMSPIAVAVAAHHAGALEGLPFGVASIPHPRIGVGMDDVGPGLMGAPLPFYDPAALKAVVPPGR